MDPPALPIPAPPARTAPAPASAPASLPGSPPARRASSEHVQLVRELWVLRERARVQAAERSFLADLTRLLNRGLPPRRRVRSTGSDDWVSSDVDDADVFESFPPPRGEFAPAREPPAGVLLREAEIARAQQRVTNLSPEFRARLEGETTAESDRSHSSGGGLQRTASWGALLAQRAVSSALDSAFRHELEGLLVRRGAHSGRALYAARGRGGGALSDGLSVGVGGADRGVRGDVEAAVRALRDEVSSLKNVIDASFDMQLDIQRAIRQEVAAAMHRAATSANPQIGTSPCSNDSAVTTSECTIASDRRDVRAVAGGACSICMDRRIDSLLYSCGHMCTCAQCGRQLIAHGETCPVCRAPVRDVVVAYMAA